MLNQSKRFIHLILCLIILFLDFSPIAVLAQNKPPVSQSEQDQLEWSNRLKEVDQLIYQATQEKNVRVFIQLRAEPFRLKSEATSSEEYKVYDNYAREVVEKFLSKYVELRSKIIKDHGDLGLSLELDAKSLAMIKYDRSIDIIQGRRVSDGRGEIDARFRLPPSPSPLKVPGQINSAPPPLNYNVTKIGAKAAWAEGYTGADKIIVVIDSGVDKSHKMIEGKVIAEVCFGINKNNSVYTSTSLCPGGATQSTNVNSGVNCSISLDSRCYHGTAVAAIAAGNDISTISGVAKDAKIIAIQVFSKVTYKSTIPTNLDLGNGVIVTVFNKKKHLIFLPNVLVFDSKTRVTKHAKSIQAPHSSTVELHHLILGLLADSCIGAR
jgi:subtilisin family serine protease